MKKFVLLLLLLFAALTAGTILFYTDTFVLQHLQVNSQWIPQEQIIQQADLRVGQNLFFLSSSELTKKIEEDHRVKSVEITKEYPHSLFVSVEARKPYVQVEYGDKQLLLDEKGTLIAVDEPIEGLPHMRGVEITTAILGETLITKRSDLFTHGIELISLCQQADLENISIEIVEGILQLQLNPEFKAIFGKGDEIEKKFNNFYTIYMELTENGTQKGTINLTNPDSPTFLPF